MDAARWSLIRQVFEAVSELPADAREPALLDACRNDAALLADVRALLALEPGAPESRVERAVSLAVTAFLDPEGERIGPYRVVRELGQGGMGAVYLAERIDGGFEQHVALKVIKPGLDSDQLLHRFRDERQILARLQHPQIARLLDGGVGDDGRPFFALEYVDGAPITAYCDAHALDVDARLALFQAACHAVTYAHANLVVHRDLKPAHILVTPDRQVRLLDFGIARMLDPDRPPDTSLTQSGIRAFSPNYASPEQIRGEAIGTATDIYSLGVILYELLTGVRPYELEGRSAAEVERIVCGPEPDRPSTRVPATPRAGGPAPAAHGAARTRRRLRGDLDVICLKALQKAPSRRYQSVEALSEDISRHRDGRPVLAQPDSLGYRARKFLIRHRVGASVAAALVILAVSFGAYHTTRLARERDRAALEAAKAREVATFLRELFETSDPSETKGRTVTARELLDAGATRLEHRLAAAPGIQASLLRVIGDVYRRLGLFDTAAPLLRRALDQHRRVFGREHDEVAESAAALATALQDQGKVAEAEPLFREALAVRQRLLGPRHEAIVESLELLAFLRETRGDVAEAERLNREALAMSRALFPVDHPRVAHAAAELGGLLRRQRRFAEAEPLLREALAAQRAHFGARDLTVASTLRDLAAMLRDRGDWDEARTLMREVVATRRAILGPDHPDVAIALNSYALLIDRTGDANGAIEAYREALRIMELTRHGRPHADLAAGYNNLAVSLRTAGRLDEAVAMYRRSLAIVDTVLAPEHANRAFARVGLAVALMQRGDFATAEPLLRESLAIRRGALAPGHRYIGDSLLELGVCLTGLKRFEEAERHLRESQAIFGDGPGKDASRARRADALVSRLYTEWRRPEPAAGRRP